MSKEQAPKPIVEKTKTLAKKLLGWAIVVGGVAVGLSWFLERTAGL